MSTIINGSSPSLTFSDGTTQSTSAIVSGFVPYANLPTGSVLQVVQSTFTSTASTSSSTMVSTGFSASITPKFSTSRILVLVGGNGDNTSGLTQIGFSIYRNSTNLSNLSFTDCYGGSSRVITPLFISYLDSPATTSSTTYNLYFASTSSAGSVTFNQGAGGTYSVATITLMEIA